MESSIDIIDPTFSLDVLSHGHSYTDDASSTSYLYIGALIVLVLASMFAYRFFQNKNDCVGGFCPMGPRGNDEEVEATA
jgi:hypothetical protein